MNFKILEEMIIAYVPGVRVALFDNKELVAHSRSSKRQVTFEFVHNKTSILAILIDEHMKRSEKTFAIGDIHMISEIIGWLTNHKSREAGNTK